MYAIENLFLDPHTAALDGGEVITHVRGTSSEVLVCLGAGPFEGAAVAVPAAYATEQREVRRRGDGWLQQGAWIFPNEKDAADIMRALAKALHRCTFSRTTGDPLQPTQRVSATSSFNRAARHGWDGYAIRQVMRQNAKRTSVSTRLLLHRGQVILALEYCNYRDGPDEELFAYNQLILDKILARST